MAIGPIMTETGLASSRAEKIYKYSKDVKNLEDPKAVAEGMVLIKRAYNARADIYRRLTKYRDLISKMDTEMDASKVADLKKKIGQVEDEMVVRCFWIYSAMTAFDDFMLENDIQMRKFKNGKVDDFEGDYDFEYDLEGARL